MYARCDFFAPDVRNSSRQVPLLAARSDLSPCNPYNHSALPRAIILAYRRFFSILRDKVKAPTQQ
jgi:hypothetical protein